MSATIALGARQSKTSVELEGIIERVGLGRTSLWRKERDGEFPRRRVIGGGIVGYLESEIDEWIRTRPVVAPNEPPPAA